MKTTTFEMQNTPNGITARQDMPQRISDIEHSAMQMKLEERKKNSKE